MEWGSIGSTVVMCMVVSGIMDSVMGLESTLAMMGAAMLGSSNGVSNMDTDSTISGLFLFFQFTICTDALVTMFQNVLHFSPSRY